MLLEEDLHIQLALREQQKAKSSCPGGNKGRTLRTRAKVEATTQGKGASATSVCRPMVGAGQMTSTPMDCNATTTTQAGGNEKEVDNGQPSMGVLVQDRLPGHTEYESLGYL